MALKDLALIGIGVGFILIFIATLIPFESPATGGNLGTILLPAGLAISFASALVIMGLSVKALWGLM